MSHDVIPSFTGVCHADDLIYLFPYGKAFSGTRLTETDEKIVDIMTTLWTNFARTGWGIIFILLYIQFFRSSGSFEKLLLNNGFYKRAFLENANIWKMSKRHFSYTTFINIIALIVLHRGNGSDLYQGGTRFAYSSGQGYPDWIFSWISSVFFRRMPGKNFEIGLTPSLKIFSHWDLPPTSTDGI